MSKLEMSRLTERLKSEDNVTLMVRDVYIASSLAVLMLVRKEEGKADQHLEFYRSALGKSPERIAGYLRDLTKSELLEELDAYWIQNDR